MNLTVDGKAVHAATGGRDFDAKLPAIVFVHGAGMDHTVWALQARYFAHRGRGVLALDLPGHGQSEGPPLTSIDAIADWLAALIAEAGLKSAALAGHSMGALAALACAARHPKTVRALALLGVAPKMPVHPDLLAAAKADDHRAFDLVTDWGHGAAAHLGHHPAPGLWLLGGAEALLERSPPGVLHNDLAACNAYQEAEAAAAKVKCPTLLVLGADDRMTPAKAGRKLAAMIDGAKVVVIPEAGHMMMSEASDATLDALKTIL
ncbi:MAG: alpha/beta fold hydrolase [Kiloniellales bacterium]